MKTIYLVGAAIVFLTLVPSLACAQAGSSEVSPLNNKDVLLMVGQKLEAEAIVQMIKASPCTFDTFPPVLRELKRRGVPEVVLKSMVEAPYGPSVETLSRDDLGEAPIYHYAEQLKQMGFITPGRNLPAARSRARNSRPKRRT